MTANLYTRSYNSKGVNCKDLLPQCATIEIHTLEWLFNRHSETRSQRVCNNQYVLIWFRQGRGQLTTATHKYELNHNTVYCLSPDHSYAMQPIDVPEGYFISVSGDFFRHYETALGSSIFSTRLSRTTPHPTIIPVDDDMKKGLEEVLVCMQKEMLIHTVLSSEIINGLIKVFLLYLSRKLIAIDGYTINREALLAKNFMDLLANHFVNNKKVSYYASELCVTPGYLTQVVKKISGFTPSYHIQQIVLCEAKRLATINAHRSMKEIAYALGFDDLAHFSKFFKANAGANFTSFKRALLPKG
jgi:AraC family transcriptional regulator, transcriptional activator of pobA